MDEYYVVLRRLFHEEDIISIYDRGEAIRRNWIDGDGNRVWVVPAKNEMTPTFVWKFFSLDDAVRFYEVLRTAEIGGIPVKEVF